MTPDEIIRLPPELRELRSYAPPGHIKAIARATAPIALSPPTTDPVTSIELTPVPNHRTTPEGRAVLDALPTGAPPALPKVPSGLTDEQRYLFDTHGYLQIPSVLEGAELAACQAAARAYVQTSPEDMPAGFGASSAAHLTMQ